MTNSRYYRITPRFWQDSDVRNQWTEDMRLLALYLMTCPHRNMVGLFYCPAVYMENDLQWTSKRLRGALDALAGSGVDFVRYDSNAQVVFLVNGLKHDAPSSGKQIEGAKRVVRNLPQTHLFNAFLETADVLCPMLSEELRSDTELASMLIRIPYSVPVPVTDPVSKTLMCDSDEPHDIDEIDEPKTKEPYPPEFEDFWQRYPSDKRVGKQAAFKNWKARLKEHLEDGRKITPEMLCAAASHYAADCALRGREVQYIKHPQGFLSKTHYFADYLALAPTAGEEEYRVPSDWAERARRRSP